MRLVQAIVDNPEAIAIAVICVLLGAGITPQPPATTRMAVHQLQFEAPPAELPWCGALSPLSR